MCILQKSVIALAFSLLILKPPTEFNINKGSALIELNKANTRYLPDKDLRKFEVYINKYGGYIIFLNNKSYIELPSYEALKDYLPKKELEYLERRKKMHSDLMPPLRLG